MHTVKPQLIQSSTAPRATMRSEAPLLQPAQDAPARAARRVQTASSLIDRILSGDSRAFLDAYRQTGGE